jgi:hypothetical protein
MKLSMKLDLITTKNFRYERRLAGGGMGQPGAETKRKPSKGQRKKHLILCD